MKKGIKKFEDDSEERFDLTVYQSLDRLEKRGVIKEVCTPLFDLLSKETRDEIKKNMVGGVPLKVLRKIEITKAYISDDGILTLEFRPTVIEEYTPANKHSKLNDKYD